MTTRARTKTGRSRAPDRRAPDRGLDYVAEALPGLGRLAAEELRGLGAEVSRVADDEVVFGLRGSPGALLGARRVVAVYRSVRFEVPRPRALLGDEHLRRLLAEARAVVNGQPRGAFDGFRLSAAGSDTKVFQRLAVALGEGLGLAHQPEEGALLIRVRRAEGGWEALLRLTPRPLSARPWRVCNMPGGLNATLGAVMNDLLGPGPDDRYLNAMCGSGTLLVERALAGPAGRLVGCDLDPEAVACAERNLAAAGVTGAELLVADATALPFPDASFTHLSANLPWGDAVGTHAGNAALYPAFLAEARRVLAPGGRAALLTHEVRLFGELLREARGWRLLDELRVFHGGHYPRAYLLER